MCRRQYANEACNRGTAGRRVSNLTHTKARLLLSSEVPYLPVYSWHSLGVTSYLILPLPDPADLPYNNCNSDLLNLMHYALTSLIMHCYLFNTSKRGSSAIVSWSHLWIIPYLYYLCNLYLCIIINYNLIISFIMSFCT